MIIRPNSTESFSKKEFGGKGYNLYLLSREGLPVPKWFGISARVFREHRLGLDEQIQTILNHQKDFARASKQIEELILGKALSDGTRIAITKAYQDLGKGRVAVRSSGIDEDSARHSFAGQLSTFLFVEDIEKLLECVQRCWASGFSERGLSYRSQLGLPLHAIEVGVVVQDMVDSEKSGVLFTVDPISQNLNEVAINSVYGVGEGLVSGLLDSDTFRIDKRTGALKDSNIVDKDSMLRRKGNGSTEEVAVSETLRKIPSLNAQELETLASLANQIENFYQSPQDVEWGWLNGKFYLLQSRPITTLNKSVRGQLQIWDNSNIIESYGGITLPLTFTFARYVYREVYLQFCEILKVPSSTIQKMEHSLSNMLGSFYGRVYYNLLNWYKLLTIIPGFDQNRSNMETMMGVGQELSDEIAQSCATGDSEVPWRKKLRTCVSGLKLLYYHFTAQSLVDNFMKYFYSVYEPFREIDYDRMPADQIYASFRELESRLLRRWHAPIINDLLCMVHFGTLKKLTQKWLGGARETLQNDLLCGEGNLESAEPTRELIRMAGAVSQYPGLRELLEETPASDCLEVLKQSDYQEFYERVSLFIKNFGFRCMSEMKLEQPDLHQDPGFLFVCLKNYLKSGQTDLHAYEEREKKIRSEAEKTVRKNLSGVKLSIYLWSLKHARKAVRNRENTRFCRTRVYGIVRRMFFAWGTDGVRKGIFEKPADVFYLTLDELKGTLDGSLTNQNLGELISLRQKAYFDYKDIEPASRFITRGLPYWQNDHLPIPEIASTSSEPLLPNQLRGTGCCPGIIEGEVKVILEPGDNLELNGQILVTKRTDPGWIPLYPSASALLVERGGLLSHSAIVAREMGLPTIVSVPGLTQKLETGLRVRIDGTTGLIEILDSKGAST